MTNSSTVYKIRWMKGTLRLGRGRGKLRLWLPWRIVEHNFMPDQELDRIYNSAKDR